MTWVASLKKLRRLSGRQWGAMVLSGAYLPLVCLSLRVAGLARTLRLFGRGLRSSQPTPDHLTNPADSVAIGRIVESFVARMPWRVGCLPLGLTQWIVLGKLGVASDLRIGVSTEQSTLIAHAWVQIDNVSLGSALHQGLYARIWSCREDGYEFQIE